MERDPNRVASLHPAYTTKEYEDEGREINVFGKSQARSQPGTPQFVGMRAWPCQSVGAASCTTRHCRLGDWDWGDRNWLLSP